MAKPKQFRPMLAPSDSPMKNLEYFQKLQLPLFASPKYDGIRCVTKMRQDVIANSELEMVGSGPFVEKCLSRTLLALPSAQVQRLFSPFQDLDGEIIVGNPSDFDVYNRTQSHVMSDDKPADDIRFLVFDCADEEVQHVPFETRLDYARDQVAYFKKIYPNSRVEMVEQTLCRTIDDILDYEAWALAEGYEGIMLKSPGAIYKHGRGTFKEGYIYKLKREQDDEGVITGFVEQETNLNEATEDACGLTKRSDKAEFKIGANTLGRFVVDFGGLSIAVAPGSATHSQRKSIWDNQQQYLGRVITFRHFSHGAKDLPRFPRFIGFKDKMNL